MRNPKGCRHHLCAPKAWRTVPILSGDYDLDASIMHRSNKDMPSRLQLHLKKGTYGPLTGYGGYSNMHGDD